MPWTRACSNKSFFALSKGLQPWGRQRHSWKGLLGSFKGPWKRRRRRKRRKERMQAKKQRPIWKGLQPKKKRRRRKQAWWAWKTRLPFGRKRAIKTWASALAEVQQCQVKPQRPWSWDEVAKGEGSMPSKLKLRRLLWKEACSSRTTSITSKSWSSWLWRQGHRMRKSGCPSTKSWRGLDWLKRWEGLRRRQSWQGGTPKTPVSGSFLCWRVWSSTLNSNPTPNKPRLRARCGWVDEAERPWHAGW